MFDAIPENQAVCILGIALVFITYVGYFFNSNNDKESKSDRSTSSVLRMRYLGFIWMGVISLLSVLIFCIFASYSLSDFGVLPSFPLENFYWIFGFAAVLIPLNYVNASKPDNLEIYPQIREKEWSTSLQRKEYFTWFLYLLGYEWLFRGVFYFSTREVLDFWPALVLNTVVYALVHMPKGLKETLWSVPLGILLCIIVERTGVFYAAVIIHFTQAASSSFFSLRAHPEMKLIKK